VNAGDTFRPADRTADIHLWVVISDPSIDPDRILIVSMTTYKPYKEDACLLDRGDHRSISHPTCIAYGLAKMRPLADFQTLIDSNLLIPDDPVTPEVLDRIR
jgi:hypothetical protein